MSDPAKREQLKRDLHRLFDRVVDQPVPGSFSELIAKINTREKTNGNDSE
jgi:hypothetical protein